ncbi:MAG: hypothetical protein A2166_00220 [Omnitrophica WOR_2 bacterium RBG_13_41_10]|nr:MAG: hypothetical protein A2166_00220 [Omnitrophica WOR_2 bacterium RBG_13_41_10]
MAIAIVEKRRFPRIKLQRPLHYQIRGVSIFNNAIGENISLGGIGLLTNNRFIAPETLVSLKINVLSRILSPTVKVVWSHLIPQFERYRIGVEFVEFDAQEKSYLADYIIGTHNNYGS